MSKVIYNGESDFQTFGAADFKKVDLEHKKVTFAKGEPTEVSDEVAAALTGSEGIFGPYSFEMAEDDAEVKGEDPGTDEEIDFDDATPVAEGKEATTEGTADAGMTEGSTSTTGTGSGKSTGRGSSTRSR